MNCSCRGDTFALLFVIINEILENLMEKTNYYNLPYKAVKELLHTDTVQGLTEHEAMERLREYGYNEFKKREHTTLWQKFVAQFKSFMIIVLLIAAAISGVTGYMNGEGITDALVAAPSAPIEAADDNLAGDREADRLVADPRLAHEAQAASLKARLDMLRAIELKRTDRFAADTSVEIGRAHV